MKIGFALSNRDQPFEARGNRTRWPWIVPVVVLGLGTLTQCSAAGEGSSAATTPPTTTSSAVATTSSVAATPAQVTEVVDGDTVKVTDPVRGAVTVRVLGIDTPETKKPGYTVGCFGPEATANATQLLSGQQVTLTADPTQDMTDRYGRTLAYLTLPDGRDYSVEAARGGFAKSYVYNNAPVSKQPEISAAEARAKAAKVGLWGPPCNGVTDSTPVTTAAPASTTAAPAPATTLAPPPPTANNPAPITRAPITRAPVAPGPAPGGAGGSVSYASCSAVRAAGAAPIYRGQPGYSSKLDRDNDGVACE